MSKRSIDLNSDMGEGFGPWTIGDGVDDAILVEDGEPVEAGQPLLRIEG